MRLFIRPVPGCRYRTFAGLSAASQYLSCNSISQLERLAPELDPRREIGNSGEPGAVAAFGCALRPLSAAFEVGSFTSGDCRARRAVARACRRLSGLLVHNNCDADEFSGLLRTVRHLDSGARGTFFPRSTWINLGGGYVFQSDECLEQFCEAIAHLRSRYDLEIFIEPGAALVRGGVTLVASVVDLFERDGKAIAVLDTTVNHMPEVFEYQDVADSEPWVSGHVDNGRFAYLLAGCSCLAGDIFGDYAFESPLAIGDQIVFPEMGAYAFVKANWFNGVNLPNIYAKSADGQITLRQQFTFADFARHNGMEQRGGSDAPVRARV